MSSDMNNDQPLVTREELIEHIKQATHTVSTWPRWAQTVLGGQPTEHHISPNGAQPGSLVHDAEAWMLAQGYGIPLEKHGLLYQAMLDQYMESL